jgi:hypothetical protein
MNILLSNLVNLYFLFFLFSSISYNIYFDKSRDSAVGIVTGYGLDGLGVRVRVPVRNRFFFSLRRPVHTGSGAHQAFYRTGTEGSFPGFKRPRREAHHSLPNNAEVKNMWIHISTPPYFFMA